MSSTKQIQYAFPTPGFDRGMDLRDYFAAKALAGGLEQGIEDDMNISYWHSTEKIATRAYAIADAMMRVRNK